MNPVILGMAFILTFLGCIAYLACLLVNHFDK